MRRGVILSALVLIGCLAFAILALGPRVNASAVSSDPMSENLTLGMEIRSDAVARDGRLVLSLPVWSGVLPRVGEACATGRVGGYVETGPGSPFSIGEAMISLQSQMLAVELGRGSVRWGSGRYATLILDDNAPPYTFVRVDVTTDTRFGGFRYSRLFGKLAPEPDTYLLGQRLDVYASQRLRLGISEVAIADSRFVGMPPNWIPLWPFYLTQHLAIRSGIPGINEDSNENLGLDMTAILGPGLTVYAELFVDDMPQRPENPGVYQLGFLLGGSAQLAGGSPGLRLDAEYARVNNYTYTFRSPVRSYLNEGRPLGFRFGPDGDRLIVMLWREHEGLELGAGVELRRRGEGRIGARWQDIGWEEAREKSFLSGVVEDTFLVRAEAKCEFSPEIGVEVGVKAGRVDNAGNQPGLTRSEFEWSLGLRYRFPST